MFSKGLLRAFLAISNVLFFIVGGVALGIGIWFALEKLYISDILGLGNFSTASYLGIICGAVILLLAFVGCGGAIFESRKMLLGYTICVMVVFILYTTSAIIAAVFQGELEDQLRNRMLATLRDNYGNNVEMDGENRRITQSWNAAQKVLRCCAVEDDGYGAYRDTWFFKSQQDKRDEQKKYIPESCCVFLEHLQQYRDVAHCQFNAYGPPLNLDPESGQNDNMYYDGCLSKVKYYASDNAGILMACGFGFAIVLVAGMVFAVMLYKKLQRPFSPGAKTAEIQFSPVETRAV